MEKKEAKVLGYNKRAKTRVEKVEKDGKEYLNFYLVFEENGFTYEFNIAPKFQMSNAQYGLFLNLCQGTKNKKNEEKK